MMTANTSIQEKWKPIFDKDSVEDIPDRVYKVSEWTTGPDEWVKGRSGIMKDGKFYPDDSKT